MDFSFLILLLLVAILYSSVGHGGASGYLALMALWGFAPETMKPWALVLNICVSLIATFQFLRSEKPEWKLFLVLIAGSIPAAYLGASIHIEQELYKKLLGGLVLFQSTRLLGFLPSKSSPETKKPKLLGALVVGTAIGMLSGMIGIGGGIILSPLLIQLRWASMKQTALLSAGFIFVNSISGLTALAPSAEMLSHDLLLALAIAIVGGTIGGWLGSTKLNQKAMRITLGVVLMIAGAKLLLG